MRVQAYCFESEEDIKLYDTEDLDLKQAIVPERSTAEWRGDGKVVLTLRKGNAPSFWRVLL